MKTQINSFKQDKKLMVLKAKYFLQKNQLMAQLLKYQQQMLQRLTIAPAQVKGGNISKNLLNEIRRKQRNYQKSI